MNLDPQTFRIGWGAADATPPRTVFVAGQHRARVSERVNDPITVTAMAIEGEGGEQAVIVSCDIVTIPYTVRDGVRANLADRAPGLDPSKVFISATHTHTAPELRPGLWPELPVEVMSVEDTVAFTVDRITDAVAQAWATRAPAGVSWGLGQAVVGHNRRWVNFDGASTMYRLKTQPEFSHIEGYEDHSVDVLFAWDADGALTGMVVNVGCPSQATEGESYLSADYWHEVRTEIRRRHGAHIAVLPQCSAAGDQSPHPMFRKAALQRMYDLEGLTERQEIGRRVADAVDRVLEATQGAVENGLPFAHRVETIHLTRRRVTEAERDDAAAGQAENQAEYERLVAEGCTDVTKLSYAYRLAAYFGSALEYFEMQKTAPKYAMEMHVVRLGDIAFATNEFELFLDYGTRIEVRSPAVQTFVVQLAGPGRYLPTLRAVSGSGYGAAPMTTPVDPEGGRELVEATVAALFRLWPDAEQPAPVTAKAEGRR